MPTGSSTRRRPARAFSSSTEPGDSPSDQPIRDLVTGRQRPIAPQEWATPHTFFPAGIGVIEYLVNLDRLGRDRVRLAALPLKLDGEDGAPARAIAILD